MADKFNWWVVLIAFTLVVLGALLVVPANSESPAPRILISDGGYHFDHVDHVHFVDKIPEGMRVPLHAPDHECDLADKAGVSGKVMIEYTVNPDGTVSDAVVKDVWHDGEGVQFAHDENPWRNTDADEPDIIDPEIEVAGAYHCRIFCGNKPDPDEAIIDDGGVQVAGHNNMPLRPEDESIVEDGGTQTAFLFGSNCSSNNFMCNKPDPDEPIAEDGTQVADILAHPTDEDPWVEYFEAQALAMIEKYQFEEAEDATKGQQMILSFGNVPYEPHQMPNNEQFDNLSCDIDPTSAACGFTTPWPNGPSDERIMKGPDSH